MPVTIRVNGTSLTLVHKFSIGISTATIPDVCKTPSPGGPVPVPYPNIANSITLSSGTTTVKGDKAMAANKGSKFAISNGDNAGVAGGVKSSTFMKEATWILYSFDVKMDGKNTARLSDKMFHNSENAANLGGEAQQPFADAVGKALADKLCDAACKAMDDKKKKDAADVKKGKTPTSKFQNLMRNRLDPKPRGRQAGLITEASQEIGGDFIGKWGAATGSGSGFVKWDIVLTGAKKAVEKGTVALSKVTKIIEVKFPGDSLTDNQAAMMKKSGTAKKVTVMDVENDCVCT
ncbi:PAAR-like domain-containing protein [Variovorax sp. AFSI2.2]|uniref:DUF4150 domain-containing protein n=1 Tax=Variovorax sp. AFSI2.2 TaxID=3384160 RepID=UPI003EBE9A0E